MEAMVDLMVCIGFAGIIMLTTAVAYGAFVFAIRHSCSLSALMEKLYKTLPMSQDDWDD